MQYEIYSMIVTRNGRQFVKFKLINNAIVNSNDKNGSMVLFPENMDAPKGV